MKFACPKCNARYSVPDEKLPDARALRFPCKRCGNVIRLRRKGPATPPPEVDAPGVPDYSVPGQATTKVAAPARLQALKQASRQPESPFDEAGEGATRIASVDEIRAQQAASARAAHDDAEWYVIVAGKQQGPWPLEQLQGLVRAGELDPGTYVWRDGMGDWRHLEEVEELEGILAARGAGERTAMMAAPELEAHLARVRDAAEPRRAAAGAASPPPVSSTLILDSPIDDAAPRRPGLAVPDIADDDGDDSDAFDAALAPFSESLDEPDAPVELRDLLPPKVPVGADPNASYIEAPPGEATRVFMATAGIFKRRRQHRVAAIVGSIVFVLFVGTIALDIAGVFTIPGMGLVYDMTGMVDPNVDRALERADAKLEKKDLNPEERQRLEKLRAKLLGTERKRGDPKRRAVATTKPTHAAPVVTQGIEEKHTLDAKQRDLALDVFSDTRKREAGIKLVKPESIQAPNLPSGLTQEAIFQVISESSRSMSLCFAEAMRKGEKLNGKMEIQMTIEATGKVIDAQIETAKFRRTTMASCALRRVKTWHFPRFNGEPVTVVFPYVLEMGM